MGADITIDEDIRRATTMPARFYRDDLYFELAKERIFFNSWQFLPNTERLDQPGTALPLTLLENFLDEPIVLTRDSANEFHCISNVCTHRGTLVVEKLCQTPQLRCRYHGRCFDLGGHFVSTPGFDEALNFPSPEDDLPEITCSSLDKFVFASIDPAYPCGELLEGMRKRIGWLPLSDFKFDPEGSQEYVIDCHWALYCENYLEGFHIPYVHPGLAKELEPRAYRTEILDRCILQVGGANSPKDAFDIPAKSPDHGQQIAAYYFFLFPNTMFNFYPWGLSVNVVTPLTPSTTRVNYYTYVLDPSKRGTGAGGALDKVEMEDQAIVQSVQRGVRSRLYYSGRYSPQHESGVHHFHRLLSSELE